MEEKKESVNVSPDPSEQRAPLSSSADEAQAHSAGSASMDPAKCGAHEIHCIEQEAELAEARVRERVRTEAAEAERALTTRLIALQRNRKMYWLRSSQIKPKTLGRAQQSHRHRVMSKRY